MKNQVNKRFYSEKFNTSYQHWSNINNKLNSDKLSSKQNQFLSRCIEEYLKYDENFDINNIDKMTQAWNNYLQYVRLNNINKETGKALFTAQSKFEPTILEESIFRMFKCFVDNTIKASSIKAYCNMYFAPFGIPYFALTANIEEESSTLENSSEAASGQTYILLGSTFLTSLEKSFLVCSDMAKK